MGIFTKNDIGLSIKRARKSAKLTQEKLAELAGITAKYIQYVESGSRIPTIKTLNKIARALQVRTKDLFPD